jgi:hypothetical protein
MMFPFRGFFDVIAEYSEPTDVSMANRSYFMVFSFLVFARSPPVRGVDMKLEHDISFPGCVV